MKQIVLFFAAVLISQAAFAQLKLELSYGYATYSMGDLKNLNDDILESLPVEGRITDDFPARPYFNGGVYYQISPVLNFGANCSYHSTGSRISYKDYSGELQENNVLSTYSPGIVLGFKIMDNIIRIEEENCVSLSISKLKMDEKIIAQTDEYNFNSYSPQFEPRIKASTRVGAIQFGLRAGYLIDFGGKNKLDKEKENILRDKQDNEIKTNWSGLRMAAILAFTFGNN